MRKGMLKKILAGLMVFAMTFMSVDAGCITAVAADLQESAYKPLGGTATGYLDWGTIAQPVDDAILKENGLPINKTIEIPLSYSSVEKGYVTSIKDQNPWGSCWAFAACAAMESYALAHGLVAGDDEPDFSEYALVYLTHMDDLFEDVTGDYTTTTDPYIGFDYGGNDQFAFKALSKWAGIYNEDISYYESITDEEKTEEEIIEYVPDENNIDYVFTGQKYIDISQVDQIKAAVMEHGAVAVAYYHSEMYSSGYGENYEYRDTPYLYNYNYATSATNHAVTLVGWDDSIAKENFTMIDEEGVAHTPNNDGAWLIKNSWGEWCGQDGYIWISYEDKGILSSDAVVYEVSPKAELDHIYQHDGATVFKVYEFGNKFASIYTIEGTEKQILEAISFALLSANANYTIDIYEYEANSDPDSGTLLTSVSGSTTYTGYYTVPITENVVLEAGDSIAIVISFNNYVNLIGGYSYNWGAFNTISTIEKGQDFYYRYHWYDYADESDSVENLCIKAFTSDVENDTTKVPENVDYNIKDYTEVVLSWNKIDYATGYEVLYCLSTDLNNPTTVQVDENSFSFEGELGKEYYFRVKALYGEESSEYSEWHSATVIIPNMPGFEVDDRYYGKMILNWIPLTDLASGYVIDAEIVDYDGTTYEFTPIEINDASVSSYVVDTTAYPVDSTITFIVKTVYESFSSSEKTSSDYYVVDEALDATVKWYVLSGPNGIMTLMVKVNTDAQEELWLALLEEGESGYGSAICIGENEASFWETGVKVLFEHLPYNQVSWLYVLGEGAMTGFQEDPFLVGGEFVAPILEVVEDVKLADGVTTTTLEAVITNEMANFDYRYQWYVSDSEDGIAIAIEGATNSTYEATVAATGVKYYYCVVSCEYGTTTTYSTQNETNGRTCVAGYLADAVISITEDIADQTYTGQYIEPEIEVKVDDQVLIRDTDYELEYIDNKDAGTARIKVTFIGEYEAFGTKEVTFKIVPIKIATEDLRMDDVADITYTGDVVYPEVSIYCDSLGLSSDAGTLIYEIEFAEGADHINAGVVEFTAYLVGNYEGSITGTLEILPIEILEGDRNLLVGSISEQKYTGSPIIPEDVLVYYGSARLEKDVDFVLSVAEGTDNTNVGTVKLIITFIGNYVGETTKDFEIVPAAPENITSKDVDINDETGYISKVTVGTTVKAFLEMLDENESVKVLDKDNGNVSNDAVLGTGMKVCVMNGSVSAKTYTIIVTGDTNGDGKINITDMIAVKAMVLKKSNLEGAYAKASDVNGDGKVNITDFIKVKAVTLKKDTIIGVVAK